MSSAFADSRLPVAPAGPADAGDGRFRAIVDAQREFVSLATADGRLVYVNAAYGRHVGRAPAALLGASLYDFIEPGDRVAVRALLSAVMSSGLATESENRMHGADGSDRWVAWTNAVHVEGSERLLLSVGRDVTARKQAQAAMRSSDDFARRTGRVAGVGGWEVDLDAGSLAWSEETRRIHEVPDDYRPTLAHALAFYPASARPLIEAVVARGMAEGLPWDLELPLVTARGRHLRVRTVGEVEFADGRPVRLVGAIQDVTERHLARQETARQTDILRSVTEAIPNTVVVVGSDGRYRFVNGAFERHCGLPRERIIGRPAVEVIGAEEMARRAPWMAKAMQGETVSFTLDYPSGQGVTHLMLTCVPLRDADGAVDGFVGISQDITAQRREEDRLTQLAQRDPLTQLLNRAGFERALAHLQQGGPAGLALMYIDLDDFKPVNDRHGHAVGDEVLAEVARRLTGLVRPSDLVARLGGDEFAVALGGVREAAHANAVAGKMLAALRRPVEVGALRLSVSASIGIAFSAEAAAEAGWRSLLAEADAHLLAAKAAGKGRVG